MASSEIISSEILEHFHFFMISLAIFKNLHFYKGFPKEIDPHILIFLNILVFLIFFENSQQKYFSISIFTYVLYREPDRLHQKYSAVKSLNISFFSDLKNVINFSGINFKFILLISRNAWSMSRRDVRSLSKWW